MVRLNTPRHPTTPKDNLLMPLPYSRLCIQNRCGKTKPQNYGAPKHSKPYDDRYPRTTFKCHCLYFCLCTQNRCGKTEYQNYGAPKHPKASDNTLGQAFNATAFTPDCTFKIDKVRRNSKTMVRLKNPRLLFLLGSGKGCGL